MSRANTKNIFSLKRALSFAIFISCMVSCALPASASALPRNTFFAATSTNLSADQNDSSCPSNQVITANSGNSGHGASCILKHIVAPITAALIALFGVVLVISIIVAGIQYSSSAGDPSKIADARKRIVNAVIAVLFFMFIYAIVNWIIPGGLKNGGNVPNYSNGSSGDTGGTGGGGGGGCVGTGNGKVCSN